MVCPPRQGVMSVFSASILQTQLKKRLVYCHRVKIRSFDFHTLTSAPRVEIQLVSYARMLTETNHVVLSK